ncbi:MAG: hypothetical protein GKR90_14200 [Pseudomonadales bacterium]|nr:hypothetical protein [Pseudomonadales bacterium]
MYWCWSIAIALALSGHSGPSSWLLDKQARALLAITMFGSVIQKSASTDYLSGDFFEFTLLTDHRFAFLSSMLGVTDFELRTVWQGVEELQQGVFDPKEISLPANANVRTAALVITYWNLVIQTLIGALALFAIRRMLLKSLSALLLLFVATTYFFAPVFGFGWLLCVWGLSIHNPGGKHRPLFLALIGLLLLYQIPFRELFPG